MPLLIVKSLLSTIAFVLLMEQQETPDSRVFFWVKCFLSHWLSCQVHVPCRLFLGGKSENITKPFGRFEKVINEREEKIESIIFFRFVRCCWAFVDRSFSLSNHFHYILLYRSNVHAQKKPSDFLTHCLFILSPVARHSWFNFRLRKEAHAQYIHSYKRSRTTVVVIFSDWNQIICVIQKHHHTNITSKSV